VCEAPLQMKSNCGCLLIDDFGRQRIAPADLLNRWIVPLESRHDYLTLPTGRKIQVPFEQIVIFSTNLEPEDLVDEASCAAFLTRFMRPTRRRRVSSPVRMYCEKLGCEYRKDWSIICWTPTTALAGGPSVAAIREISWPRCATTAATTDCLWSCFRNISTWSSAAISPWSSRQKIRRCAFPEPETMSTSALPSNSFDRNEPIPGYRIEKLIGRGGCGEVWRAIAPGGIAKAIKIVYGDADATHAETEMRALSRIKDVRQSAAAIDRTHRSDLRKPGHCHRAGQTAVYWIISRGYDRPNRSECRSTNCSPTSQMPLKRSIFYTRAIIATSRRENPKTS